MRRPTRGSDHPANGASGFGVSKADSRWLHRRGIPCPFAGRLACAPYLAIACPARLIRACVWWCTCCWNDPPSGP